MPPGYKDVPQVTIYCGDLRRVRRPRVDIPNRTNLLTILWWTRQGAPSNHSGTNPGSSRGRIDLTENPTATTPSRLRHHSIGARRRSHPELERPADRCVASNPTLDRMDTSQRGGGTQGNDDVG